MVEFYNSFCSPRSRLAGASPEQLRDLQSFAANRTHWYPVRRSLSDIVELVQVSFSPLSRCPSFLPSRSIATGGETGLAGHPHSSCRTISVHGKYLTVIQTWKLHALPVLDSKTYRSLQRNTRRRTSATALTLRSVWKFFCRRRASLFQHPGLIKKSLSV